MTIGHLQKTKPFKPIAMPHAVGGSKKGKPQQTYPLLIRVVCDAVAIQNKGTIDSMLVDRIFPSAKVFKQRLETLLPGIWEYLEETMGPRKTSWEKLLQNRVYKTYYNGTSARGINHNPETRAAVSKEHWRNHPEARKYEAVHDSIVVGDLVVWNAWKECL